MESRDADFIIRPQGNPQTYRWWIIPRNRLFNIYLHRFVLSDEDRALHDHPWINASILLSGEYIEHTPSGKFNRKEGFAYFRRARSPHRIELIKEKMSYSSIKSIPPVALYNNNGFPVITLFITGPRIREWGFWCPNGFRHWKVFCDERDHGVIGRGCE